MPPEQLFNAYTLMTTLMQVSSLVGPMIAGLALATGGAALAFGIDTLTFIVSYHDYGAEAVAADYGSEWNASIAAKHKRFNLMLKYADYQQGELASARTTSKLWAQLEFVW